MSLITSTGGRLRQVSMSSLAFDTCSSTSLFVHVLVYYIVPGTIRLPSSVPLLVENILRPLVEQFVGSLLCEVPKLINNCLSLLEAQDPHV